MIFISPKHKKNISIVLFIYMNEKKNNAHTFSNVLIFLKVTEVEMTHFSLLVD